MTTKSSIPSTRTATQDSYKTEVSPDQFPEGGTTAWFTVVGGALVLFCGFGYTATFGVYQEFYALHYLANESSSAISWIGSIDAFLGTSLGLIAGILHDRGYFYHLLIGGSLLQSFALFMLSLTRPGQYYPILLAQGIGLGIAHGMVYVPTMAVVSQHFRRRRTLMMSLVASGAPIGSVVHPIMLNYLFNRGVGFANGVRISAAFISILLLIACLLMRTRLEPHKHVPNYLSVGRDIIYDIPFSLMSIGMLLFQIALFFPFFYLQLDSVKHGNPETISFYSLALLNAGNFFGRISAGFVASRVGVANLMIAATTTCGVLIFCMIGLSSAGTVVALGVVYGCFGGIYTALMAPLMALLTNDLSQLGARMGMAMMFAGIGCLLSGPISGALLTSQYKWWQPCLFNGLVALGGSSLLVIMQILLMQRRRKGMTEGQKLPWDLETK